MKNAWLVRPYPHDIKRVSEFKHDNIVAIGWAGIGDLTGKSREDIKAILSRDPYNLSGLQLGNAYATIDIFVNRMQVEDYVLVPDGEDIYFGRIIGDYYLEPSVDNSNDGYPHQRKVEWLSNSARKDLSMALRSSLKVHRTTADLSKHYDEIQSLANGNTYMAISSINVSYPLRPDFDVIFSIPSDITKSEAKRLSLYFESLYYKDI